MTLVANVEAHHRLQYANSVTLVAQQTLDRLAAAVTVIDAKGEAQSTTDLFNAVEYQYGEARTRRNTENPVSGDRRWLVMPPMIKSGQYIDREDKWATATDPNSTLVTVHTHAVQRGVHDRTLGIRKDPDTGLFLVEDGGILGNATSGKRADTVSALPSGQYVPRGSTGLTLDKIRDARLALQMADFGMEDDDPLVCLISPNEIDDLIGIAAAATPYQNGFSIEELRTGKPQSLLGISWIATNRLPVASDDATVKLCPIFSKKNIVRGMWQGIQGDMWNDTHADNLPYVRVSAAVDCVRNQDKGVVVIESKH